jgi:secondary thiamine-phosphate synthase enzyme
MEVITKHLHVETKGTNDLVNITDQVKDVLAQVSMTDGLVNIFVVGSTAAITSFEYESGMIADMQDFYEKIASQQAHYMHDETWNDANGFSHVRAAIQGPSIIVPFEKSNVLLGAWQQIVLVEFDTRPRQREIILTFIGM